MEHVCFDHKANLRIEMDSAGRWVEHPHQPVGARVFDWFSKELKAAKRRPLCFEDFRS